MHLSSASFHGNLPRAVGYGASSGVKLPPEDVIFGHTSALATIRERILRVAPTDIPMVITGESGTGKDAIAHLIHNHSAMASKAFVQVNCAAIPASLIESELFGYEKGSFTGAVGSKPGRVELANGGTLFLDEIGELDPGVQAKLLQLLQDGEFSRIGGQEDRKVNVRFIFATNRDLEEEILAGNFREDLYYRINVANLHMPPLRERLEDVPLLAQAFWRQVTAEVKKRVLLGPDAIIALCRHSWPGNVRELQNAIAALAVIAPSRGRVTARHVQQVLAGDAVPPETAGVSLDVARRSLERRLVAAALVRHAGRRAEAARELGLSRQGLIKAIKRLGVDAGPDARGVA